MLQYIASVRREGLNVIHGIINLVALLTALMNKIYNDKEIPAQWKISKIIPVHKKSESSNIENYPPISNICSRG